MKLTLRDPISSIEDLNENMPIIEHNLNPVDKSLIKHIREEIEKELTLEQIDHYKTGGSDDDFPGLSTKKIEEIIEGIQNTEGVSLIKKINDVYNSRGEAKLQLSEYESAFSDFSKADKIAGFLGTHQKNMGIAKFHLRQYQEAIDYFDKALTCLFPMDEHEPEVYYYRGLAKYQLGQHLSAIIDFDKALDVVSFWINNLGAINYLIHKIKEMKQFVVEQFPENDRIIFWRYQTILDLHGKLCVCGKHAEVVHNKSPYDGVDIYNKPLSDYSALCKICCDHLKGENPDGFNKFSNISSIPGYTKEYEQNKNEKLPYDNYLNSDSWKIKNKMVFERDGKKCICGNEGSHVHHKTYERLRLTLTLSEEPVFIGEELLSDLITVCESCHKKIHGRL